MQRPPTIDILAPGPSLKAYDRMRKPDITICINRAILQFPCDFWAVQDRPLWMEVKERPRRGILTNEVLHSRISNESYVFIMLRPSSVKGVNWTAPRVIDTVVHAFYGADINLFGFDMVGITYYDKTEWKPNANRHSRRTMQQLRNKADKRWKQESEMIQKFLELPFVRHHKA